MGRYFALTLSLPAAAPSKIKTKKQISDHGRPTLALWLLAVVVVFGLSYLFLVNSTSTKGYEIKKLERSMSTLRETNKRLELEMAALKSIQHMENTVRTLNLVPSEKVYYVGEQGYAYQRR